MNFIVKDIEGKLGPFKITVVDKSNVKTDDKKGEGEGGENKMNNSAKNTNASDMTSSSNKVEVSDTLNTTQNKDNKPSYVENEGHEENTQTSNTTNLSDSAKIDQDVATTKLTIEANENSTQTHNEKISNAEVSIKNEGSADNNIKSKFIEDNKQISNEDSKFKDKDNEQNTHDSKMAPKGDAENIEGGN